MAITSGQLTANQYNAVNTATGSDAGTSLDQRRVYNFSDRIAELAPEESPFFVYLSKVAKLPTDDSLFRFLEDRSKIDYTSREFLMKGAVGTVVAGVAYAFIVDDTAGASVDWLIKGMVIAVRTVGDTDAAGFGNAIFRIENAPTDNGTDTGFQAKCISFSGATGSDVLANNDKVQVSVVHLQRVLVRQTYFQTA